MAENPAEIRSFSSMISTPGEHEDCYTFELLGTYPELFRTDPLLQPLTEESLF
jgi:hypothetical protein